MNVNQHKVGDQDVTPAKRVAPRRALAAVAAAVLTGAAIVPAAASTAFNAVAASTSVTTINPFSINNGFSILSKGNVVLQNNELEGSVAAFGTVSNGTNTNYPLVHKVAGEADYSVPVIDGDPVRLLASQYVGTGNMAITNAGANSAGSPESQAIGKLVDTSSLVHHARSGMFRTHVSSELDNNIANLDFYALPESATSFANIKAAKSSVSEYFESTVAHESTVNACLAAASSRVVPADIANHVTLAQGGDAGMVFPTGFSATTPNVVQYSDWAGKTVKADRAGGYIPTAQAPLIVKVPAGTTNIGKFELEGWNASSGAQQKYARYIMFDLSEVTGTVTIDGTTLGAVWAPNANLYFDSGTTTNGQWYSKSFETSAQRGELHHHSFLGQIKCAVSDSSPEPSPSTTSPEPSPSTTSPEPSPSTTSPEPSPSTTSPEPSPSTTSPEPTPSTPVATPTTPSDDSTITPGPEETKSSGVQGEVETRDEESGQGTSGDGDDAGDNEETTDTSGSGTDNSNGLADTGAMIGGAIGAAAFLVAGGAGAIALRRRN